MSQDFNDYEYLIVDGGSTDGTIDLIRSFESKFEGRLHWCSEPDNGIYDAFNKGCRMAKGTYYWIVNSDDFLESGALTLLSSIISKCDTARLPIISGAARFLYGNGITKNISYTREDAAFAFSIADIGIAHPATVIPAYIYEEVGLYDSRYKIMADMDWFRRAYLRGGPFLWIPDVLTNMTEGGISTRINLSKLASDRWIYTCKFYDGRINRYSAFIRWMFMHLKGDFKSFLVKNRIIKDK